MWLSTSAVEIENPDYDPTVLGSPETLWREGVSFDVFEADWEVVAAGSIEHKLALIGAGEAGITLSRGPKWEWDVCAGAVIVEEAGGVASDLSGDPLTFNKPFPKVKGILAGAPGVYREALHAVRDVGASNRMNEFDDLPSGSQATLQ